MTAKKLTTPRRFISNFIDSNFRPDMGRIGADGRNRTDDLLITSEA